MILSYQCLSFSELTLEQLYALMALRQEVFVVEQNCPYLDADGRDQEAWHLLGYGADGRLLAYTRLLPNGVAYAKYAAIGRVVTAASVRGKGIGREIMQRSLEWMEKLWPGVPVKISAQSHLENFYRSLHFQPTGEAYLEDGIPHLAMVRE